MKYTNGVNCIVSGGGIDKNKQWKEAVKAKHKFLFPAKAVQLVYRPYFLKQLQKKIDKGIIKMNDEQHKDWLSLRTSLYNMKWVVDFREPMGGPGQVVEYLARYTHKVAISNHRIKHIDADNNITFEYKDYVDGGKKKKMSLSGKEFLRRYEQHLLPKRFCKIRNYGYLGNYKRKERVNEILKKMGKPEHPVSVQVSMAVRMIEKLGANTLLCPCCKKASLELLYVCHSGGAIKEVLRE